MFIDNVPGKVSLIWCPMRSIRAGSDRSKAGSQQIHHALPPSPYPSCMIGSVWRFEIDHLMSNHNRMLIFHLDSEPSGREQLLPQDLSGLLHAGILFGTAFDHTGFISPRTIRVEITSHITQYRWVA